MLVFFSSWKIKWKMNVQKSISWSPELLRRWQLSTAQSKWVIKLEWPWPDKENEKKKKKTKKSQWNEGKSPWNQDRYRAASYPIEPRAVIHVIHLINVNIIVTWSDSQEVAVGRDFHHLEIQHESNRDWDWAEWVESLKESWQDRHLNGFVPVDMSGVDIARLGIHGDPLAHGGAHHQQGSIRREAGRLEGFGHILAPYQGAAHGIPQLDPLVVSGR